MSYANDWSFGGVANTRQGNYQKSFSPKTRSPYSPTAYRGRVAETFKKHSGAKAGQDKNGNPYVNGWNYQRRNGLRSFFAAPYKGTKKHTSKSGRVWENWMVKMRLANGTEEILSGLRDTMTGKIIIKQLGFVMNPKARNGGYCGTFSNK